MTTFTQPASDEKKLIPFLKLGAFDENNYRPAELKKTIENEKKYGTLRLLPGETVEGTITGFYGTSNGDVMYIKDVQITRIIDGGGLIEKVGAVKIGLSHDLDYLIRKNPKGVKEVGNSISLKYRGLEVSPKDASRQIHKFDIV